MTVTMAKMALAAMVRLCSQCAPPLTSRLTLTACANATTLVDGVPKKQWANKIDIMNDIWAGNGEDKNIGKVSAPLMQTDPVV